MTFRTGVYIINYMKLNKLELSAFLGMQARNRELVFMKEQIDVQLKQLEEESKEIISDIESRLELDNGVLTDYDLEVETGELVLKPLDDFSTNGHKSEYDLDAIELDEIN